MSLDVLNTIMPNLNSQTDLCPCGSGRLLKDCCLQPDKSIRPPQCITRPPAAPTGTENRRCYAAPLSDCSSVISREHYVSNGILRAISGGQLVEASGFPWQTARETRSVSIASLASKILCQRHNSVLSPLDSIGCRFFNALDQIDQEFRDRNTEAVERIFLFNGHDIERWMLKALCGAATSGNTATADLQAIRGWTPPDQWLRILFGLEFFPQGWGLYVDGMPGDTFDASRDVKLAPVYDGTKMLGVILWFNNYRFFLVMSTVDDRQGTLLERATYRPKEFCMTTGMAIKMIVLGWDEPGDAKSIHIAIRPRPQIG